MRSRLRHRFTIELKFPFTLFVFLCPWWWRANRWKKKIIRNYDYTLFSKYLLDNKTGGIKQNICQNNNIKSNINRSYFILRYLNCSQHYLIKKDEKLLALKSPSNFWIWMKRIVAYELIHKSDRSTSNNLWCTPICVFIIQKMHIDNTHFPQWGLRL